MNFLNSLWNSNKTTASSSTTSTPPSSSTNRNQNSTMSSSSNGGYTRRAYHAGSWYSSNRRQLDEQLTQFMVDAAQDMESKTKQKTGKGQAQPLRASIVPHAGYSYSGPTAGYSYHEIQQEIQKTNSSNNSTGTTPPIRTILVLHPSHHVALSRCDVSGAATIETPLGNLPVDEELRTEILQLASNNTKAKTPISIMTQTVDEHEHSGEMQYPYLYKCCNSSTNSGSPSTTAPIKVLPIMCGNLSTKQEQEYGHLLAPIIARPSVLTVISSDFCHWGSRFGYQPTPDDSNNNAMSISQFIRELDHDGMRPIELQNPGGFAMYLKRTRNTICGRHPIAVYLHAIDFYNNISGSGGDDTAESTKQQQVDIEFIMYDQSSQVQSLSDSSVSYAAAVARLKA